MKKKCAFFFVILMIVAILSQVTLLPQIIRTDASEKRTIRIGYTDDNPFIKIVNGVWTGYGVDYLEKIAEYTNWEYQYVRVEEKEVEKDLANQDIDFAFLTSGRQNPYARLLQSEFFVAYENNVIYAQMDDEIYYEDFEALDECTIGILAEDVNTNEIYEFLDEKGIFHESRIYSTHDQLHEALEDGIVDVICHGSLYDCRNLRIVCRFGVNEYYCFTAKQNVELMQALDEAVEQLKFDDPDFEGELYSDYFGHSHVSDTPMFTREETEYIAKADPIPVKLMLGSIPLSYLNSDGEPDGIFVEFFKLLEKKSGLKFDIQIETDATTMESLTKGLPEGDYVMLRAKRAIEDSEAIDQLRYSIPLVENHLSYIRRREDVSDSGRMDYVFAATKEMHYLEPLLKFYSKEFTINYYDSTKKCLDAVVDGEADIAIQDAYLMNYILQKPLYADKLVECPGQEWVNEMCVVAGAENEILINIINKSIRHITKSEKEAIPTLEILLNPYQLTVEDVFYQYRDIFVGIILLTLISLIIYTILIRNLTKVRIEMKDYKNLQKKIQEDELTGLFNRPYFYRRSREMISGAKEKMCIVLMNIVNFQVVNDLYNMDTGDLLLKEIAESLKKLSTEYNMIAGRFTGDRFYLCLPLKEFFRMSMPHQFTSKKIDMDIRLNYGVFIVEDQNDLSISEMCDRAAIAVHSKERKEIEYIRYYSEEEHNQLLEKQQIESEMKTALEDRQFCAFIQPKYDVEKECIVGGEALVRWKHPEKGLIPPYKFIGIFERTGFIVQLDYYIWEETCRYIADWKQKGIFRGPISVNVSRAHFYNRELKDKLLELTAKYRIQPSDLQLEITETICAEENDTIYRKIQELRDCGFEIAMDDFGSGYSSLNMLKEIPLDVIKMDLKFLDGSGDQGKSRYILESLIRIAQNMQLKVVVEGTETQEQVKFLKSIGNVCAQGYYYAKPVEAEEYAQMLAKQ
ncbi:MAG: EAL domain-containing protein [Agathobacter sp.]